MFGNFGWRAPSPKGFAKALAFANQKTSFVFWGLAEIFLKFFYLFFAKSVFWDFAYDTINNVNRKPIFKKNKTKEK